MSLLKPKGPCSSKGQFGEMRPKPQMSRKKKALVPACLKSVRNQPADGLCCPVGLAHDWDSVKPASH